MTARAILLAIPIVLWGCRAAPTTETLGVASLESREVASLIDPAELDALQGKRAATPRLRRICHRLAFSGNPEATLDRALGGSNAPRASETRAALLRNLTILERLGCLDGVGMSKLARGLAPTIKRGPYAGELATVDHIVPVSVCPELGNRLYNLEFMPDTLNRRKGAKVGQRQRQLARRWHGMGLLSEAGLRAVEAR